MKRIIFIIVVITLSLILACNSYSQEQKTYIGSGSYFDYSIDYPSDWQLVEAKEGVGFLSPLKDKTPAFRENVSVMVKDLNLSSDSINLEDYEKANLDELSSNLPGFQLLEKDKAIIDDQNSSFMIYKCKDNTGNIARIKLYLLISGSNAYCLSYVATDTYFNEYLSQAENIIKSIKINK